MTATATPGMEEERDKGGLTGFLLAIWMAFLVADRVDLLGGSASFRLTPFLFLTPILSFVATVRLLATKRRLQFGPFSPAYLILLLFMIAVVFLSTLFADQQVVSTRRSLLFVAISGGTLLVAGIVAGERNLDASLVAGAKLGLVVAILFGFVQFLTLFSAKIPPLLKIGPGTVDLSLLAQIGAVPRLSGQVLDPNRAGFLFLVYLFVILAWDRSRLGRRVWAGIVLLLLLLTFSRSALLGVAAASGFLIAGASTLRVRRGFVLAVMTMIVVFVGGVLAGYRPHSELVRSVAPLAQRFSPREGSAREHVLLLGMGIRKATASVEQAGIGIGYGNAHRYLEALFPNTTYSSFHSLYVSMFAETGVLGLLLLCVLLFFPLGVPGPLRPLVAAAVIFNFTYEVGLDPSLWFCLALAWLTAAEMDVTPLPH